MATSWALWFYFIRSGMISQERGKDLKGGAFQKAYGAALSGSLLWHLTACRDQRLLSNKLSLASRSGSGTCRPVGGALRHLCQLSVKARWEAASPQYNLSFLGGGVWVFFYPWFTSSCPSHPHSGPVYWTRQPLWAAHTTLVKQKIMDGFKPVASLLAFCTLSCRRRFSHKLFLTLVLDEPETGREVTVYSVGTGGRKKKRKEMSLEHIKKECKALEEIFTEPPQRIGWCFKNKMM